LCKFPKPWYIQKFNFYQKIIFLQLSAQSAQWPTSPSSLFGPEQPSRLSWPSRLRPPSSLPHRASGTAASSSRGPAAPLPRHGATPTDAPLLNSVACLYSVVNPPPPLFTTCNQRLHGRPLKPPLVPPPPSEPYKMRRPSPGPRRTHPHSPPLLSELVLHHIRAPLPPPICRRCPTVMPPNEPG
jgi:hypothetical protein